LHDVAGQVIIPRTPHQVCKKPVPVLFVKCSEINHFSYKTLAGLKGYS
jgi:hypothetical protein